LERRSSLANYAYINISLGPPKATKADRIAAFTPVLQKAVLKALGDRWKVSLADFEDEGPTWLVTLPGTAEQTEEGAMRRMRAPGEDIGFAVCLGSRRIAFRHGPNMFESWAQGCVEEELADFYNRGIFFDATNRTQKPGARAYRQGKTFQEYLSRNLVKPLSDEDRAYIDRHKETVPEGFW